MFVSFKWLLKERERRKTFFLSTCIHLFNLSLFFKVRISPSKKVESPLKIMKNACFFILKALFVLKICNPLSANFTKWSNTLKQFVGKLPTNCLSVFENFVGLALKGLKVCLSWHKNPRLHFNESCKKMTLTRWRFTVTTKWRFTYLHMLFFFSNKRSF